ncbi:uncharacterized protein LOC121763879 [Salvia splendens]|uniref:uncharacterized protein LOC121763879 n=1 Tax=Salvia splendens TaxID=180675 RepID=UPI001C267AD1|nr:uncharacterized protein LOC121763879 [Salvia splendens]
MVGISTLLRYFETELDYSISVARMAYLQQGQIVDKQILDIIWRTFSYGRLTFLHWNKGKEMEPNNWDSWWNSSCSENSRPDPMSVHVGDVVVMKDPKNSAKFLIRRLAAIEGDEMASKDAVDEPFVLEEDQCWVLADNDKLKPKQAYDSRIFGPVTMTSIVGRAIYCVRNDVDHGPVKNSEYSTTKDSPVLEFELDVDEILKNRKA